MQPSASSVAGCEHTAVIDGQIKVDNTKKDVTLKGRGNSRSYTMARLDRDRPELAAHTHAFVFVPHTRRWRSKPAHSPDVPASADRQKK